MRLSDLHACPQWLASRNPAITLAQFQEWWCPSGALCRVHVSAGGPPKLQVVWGHQQPVPLPPVPVPDPAGASVASAAMDLDVDIGEDLYASDVDLYE